MAINDIWQILDVDEILDGLENPTSSDVYWATQKHGARYIAAVAARRAKASGVQEWVGDGTTDQTAAIQAAIDACPIGGTVRMPVGVFKLTSALTIDKDITLRGSGVGAVMGTADQSALGMLPKIDPYLTGSVLLPSTAGQNAIEIVGTQITVNLRNFGVRFADAIRGADTGHGIYAAPSAVRGSGHELGLYNSLWENIKVFGHDGDHYGFFIQNFLFCTFVHLASFGGGGIMVDGEMDECAVGNSSIISPYVCQVFGTTTNCYTVSGSGANSGMNLLSIVKPCAVMGGATPPAPFDALTGVDAGQYLWRHVGDAVNRISVYDPDLEGPLNPIDFGGDGAQVVVRNGGILFSSNATGLAFATEQLPVNVDTGLTVTGGNGAGIASGGTVTLPFGGRDHGCRIRIDTGSAPFGAGNLICSVTFGVEADRDAIFLQPHESLAASVAGFYTYNLTTTGFDVYAQEQLEPSTRYDVFFVALRSFA